MREQRDMELAGGGGRVELVGTRHYDQDQPSISQHLVCQPHNRNITGGWSILVGVACSHMAIYSCF